MKKYLLSSAFIFLAAFAFSQTPILNSRPSVTNSVIYLDFDGQVVSGTLWNTSASTVAVINALPSTLSANNKIIAWKRISEDFIPFDVNITTDSLRFNSAPANRRMRVVITPTSYWYANAGGVAYVNSFTWGAYPGTPCWVFEDKLSYSAKNVAEAASHEIGHTLSLRHHGVWNSPTTPCTLTAQYSNGVGTGIISWAPIMGVGYTKNVTIWHAGRNTSSNGTYPCGIPQNDHSNNATYGITHSSRLSFVTDDVGDTYNTAKTLNLSSVNLVDSGLISTPSDIDVYKFTICNNRYVSFNIKPWALDTSNTYSGSTSGYQGANLDIRFHLYNATTNSLIAVDTTLTRLFTLRGLNLTAGDYYFTVDGGRSSNYDDYGSLGRYYMYIKATNPPVLSNTIVTNPTYCANQNAFLTYTSNGTPTSWQWLVTGSVGTNTYTTSNLNLSFNSAGIYTISLLASSAASPACAVTKTINITPLPNITVSSSNSEICLGSSATLTANGASSYSWDTGSTNSVIAVNPSISTAYTVVGSQSTCSATAVFTLFVSSEQPSVTISSSSPTICLGSSATLTANGASSYSWNTGSTDSVISVNPNTSTAYTVVGGQSTCVATAVFTLYVSPISPISTLSVTNPDCNNACTGVLNVTTSSGTAPYSYSLANSNCTTMPCTNLCDGLYTLYTYDAVGCNSFDIFSITCYNTPTTSINELKTTNTELKIYPNPTHDYVTIEAQTNSKVEIFNTLGSLVFSNQMSNSPALLLNTENWAKGIYFVKAISPDKTQAVKKLVIE